MENIGGKVVERNVTVDRAKKIILALQHMIAMFGATVLVPLITGFDVGTALFCAGCGTLIFHFCTKKKVPVFFRFIICFYTCHNLCG